LARLAAEVREAIADPARRPRYLRTVHGFGYAFCGEVVEPLPESPRARPACRLVWGEREIPLPEGTHIAGRADDAVVKIASPKVSRQHARIVVTPNEATIEDLGSKNGTFVLGVRLENRRVLADGDEILIGPVLLTFRTGAQGSTEANVG
jgi:hypothetical protein